MKIAQDISEVFSFAPLGNQVVGFHSTARSTCASIEQYGFLPNKIFDLVDHSRLVELAKHHGIDTVSYENWLCMRSVTFTINPDDAIKHICHGRAGGQGLKNMSQILEALPTGIGEPEKDFLKKLRSRIDSIRADQCVTYVVDLSELGPRLDKDRYQPFYYYRWNPAAPLPEFSEIAPSRIVMKLVHPPS